MTDCHCEHVCISVEEIHRRMDAIKINLTNTEDKINSHINASGSVEDLRRKMERMQTQINGLAISRDHQSAQNKQFMETLDAHITNTIPEGKKRICYICGYVNPTYYSEHCFKLICRECVLRLYNTVNGWDSG